MNYICRRAHHFLSFQKLFFNFCKKCEIFENIGTIRDNLTLFRIWSSRKRPSFRQRRSQHHGQERHRRRFRRALLLGVWVWLYFRRLPTQPFHWPRKILLRSRQRFRAHTKGMVVCGVSVSNQFLDHYFDYCLR